MDSGRPLDATASARLVLALVALLVAQTAVAPVAAASPSGESEPRSCVETTPEGPGGVPVTVERGPVENSVTLSVSRVKARTVLDSLWGITLPSGTELHSTSGFEADSDHDRLYRPVENARNYSLTYTYEENGTLNGTSLNGVVRPFEGEEEWAVAPLPQDYNGLVSYRTSEEAVIGQQTVFFGDYTMTTVANGCHRIRLVVPDSVDLNRNTTAVLDSLQYTDRHLGGQRYDEVTIFVSPEDFSSGYEGVALGADIVMSGTGEAIGENDDRTHLWIHEYTHTRQSFFPTGELAWWTEASANYLSIRMGLRSGYLSSSQYNEVLTDYGEEDTGDAVLANESTWHNWSTYKRGVLALAQLDATLREDTNGSVTVAAVFNATEHTQPETYGEFMVLLENQTGNRYDEWSDDYIRGTATGELKMKTDSPSLLNRAIVPIVKFIAVLLAGLSVFFSGVYVGRQTDGEDTGGGDQ